MVRSELVAFSGQSGRRPVKSQLRRPSGRADDLDVPPETLRMPRAERFHRSCREAAGEGVPDFAPRRIRNLAIGKDACRNRSP
jgi:hypothetical protein